MRDVESGTAFSFLFVTTATERQGDRDIGEEGKSIAILKHDD